MQKGYRKTPVMYLWLSGRPYTIEEIAVNASRDPRPAFSAYLSKISLVRCKLCAHMRWQVVSIQIF